MSTMLMSMTGFGEASADAGTHRVEVSVRSVNHRQLDVRVSLPNGWAAREATIVGEVKRRLHRGRVEVRVSVRRSETAGGFDPAEARKVADDLRAVAEAAGLAAEPTLADVLTALARRPDAPDDGPGDGVLAASDVALASALDAFEAFRAREGAALYGVFVEQLKVVEEVAGSVEAIRLEELEAHRDRLRARVTELLDGQARLDDERLASEIVLIAERSDVAEEIQRAMAHVEALRALLEAPGPHGKRLDFLLQELIRETNTMGSKSASSKVTHRVVDAKTAVERMREQALNVE